MDLALRKFVRTRAAGRYLAGFDPFDESPTRFVHPRLQRWEDHFALRGPLIEGITAVGRTTVAVLAMNDRHRVQLRADVATRTPDDEE